MIFFWDIISACNGQDFMGAFPNSYTSMKKSEIRISDFGFSDLSGLRGWLLEPVFFDFLVERGSVDAQQAGSAGNIPPAGPEHL